MRKPGSDPVVMCAGVQNCLRKLGLLTDAPPTTRTAEGWEPTVVSQHASAQDYIVERGAPSSGLWAAAVEPGDFVAAGDSLCVAPARARLPALSQLPALDHSAP